MTWHAHTQSVLRIHQVFKDFHEYLIPQLFLLSFFVSVLISIALGIYSILKLPLIVFNKCVCGKALHTGKVLSQVNPECSLPQGPQAGQIIMILREQGFEGVPAPLTVSSLWLIYC